MTSRPTVSYDAERVRARIAELLIEAEHEQSIADALYGHADEHRTAASTAKQHAQDLTNRLERDEFDHRADLVLGRREPADWTNGLPRRRQGNVS